MIFGLQYGLVVAGYSATAFLLGNYMVMYTGASEMELGFIFTIQPAVIMVRPFVCSLADRYQAHRTIYVCCALLSFLCHLPFILLPFLVVVGVAPASDQHSQRVDGMPPATTLAALLTERVRFWILVVSHFIGCILFCCMRTLGDVLTVNYCRRLGTNYTNYRKFGPISFGLCSLILGYTNCNQALLGLPDYVLGFVLYSSCHLALFVLFYLWPGEFFEMVSECQLEGSSSTNSPSTRLDLEEVPNSRQIRQHIKTKLLRALACFSPSRSATSKAHRKKTKDLEEEQQEGAVTTRDDDGQHTSTSTTTTTTRKHLSAGQQAAIFWFLVKHDLRIPLFLLILVGCGVVGHSVQNFVYVSLAKACQEQHQNCQAATISGYIMFGICVTETLAYSMASYGPFQASKNRLLKVQLTLVVLLLHYLTLGFLVQHSAYYFLAEAMHGLEFGLMIATSLEWGDMFANEVHLIVGQLEERKIIDSKRDKVNLVRVSLNATMIACFLLVYDGLGGVIGSLMYGYVVDRYGFSAAFQLNALATGLLLVVIMAGSLASKCFPLRILARFDSRSTSRANSGS